MGIGEKEFRLTTPRYFYFRSKGFETVMLENARNARIVAFYAIAPHVKKGAVRRPEDLYPLQGDRSRLEAVESSIQNERAYMARILKTAKSIDVFAGETMPKIIPEA